MQIVLSGNRVIAHGEDCFLCMGGTVICEDTGKAYQNATIAEVDSVPADIDTVGYEYHAGIFVPCAPYGKGGGNIMVACEECGAPKSNPITASPEGDIDIPGYLTGGKIPDDIAALFGLDAGAYLADALSAITTTYGKVAKGTYAGKGTYGSGNANSLTFGFEPKFVFIQGYKLGGYESQLFLIHGQTNTKNFNVPSSKSGAIVVSWSGKMVTWYNEDSGSLTGSEIYQCNASGVTYHYFAIG